MPLPEVDYVILRGLSIAFRRAHDCRIKWRSHLFLRNLVLYPEAINGFALILVLGSPVTINGIILFRFVLVQHYLPKAKIQYEFTDFIKTDSCYKYIGV
jgi:hypothetical protein